MFSILLDLVKTNLNNGMLHMFQALNVIFTLELSLLLILIMKMNYFFVGIMFKFTKESVVDVLERL